MCVEYLEHDTPECDGNIIFIERTPEEAAHWECQNCGAQWDDNPVNAPEVYQGFYSDKPDYPSPETWAL